MGVEGQPGRAGNVAPEGDTSRVDKERDAGNKPNPQDQKPQEGSPNKRVGDEASSGTAKPGQPGGGTKPA